MTKSEAAREVARLYDELTSALERMAPGHNKTCASHLKVPHPWHPDEDDNSLGAQLWRARKAWREAEPDNGPLRTVDPEAFVSSLMRTASGIRWTTAEDGVRVSALLHEVQNYLLPDTPTGKTFVHSPECALADGLENECDCGGRDKPIEETP